MIFLIVCCPSIFPTFTFSPAPWRLEPGGPLGPIFFDASLNFFFSAGAGSGGVTRPFAILFSLAGAFFRWFFAGRPSAASSASAPEALLLLLLLLLVLLLPPLPWLLRVSVAFPRRLGRRRRSTRAPLPLGGAPGGAFTEILASSHQLFQRLRGVGLLRHPLQDTGEVYFLLLPRRPPRAAVALLLIFSAASPFGLRRVAPHAFRPHGRRGEELVCGRFASPAAFPFFLKRMVCCAVAPSFFVACSARRHLAGAALRRFLRVGFQGTAGSLPPAAPPPPPPPLLLSLVATPCAPTTWPPSELRAPDISRRVRGAPHAVLGIRRWALHARRLGTPRTTPGPPQFLRSLCTCWWVAPPPHRPKLRCTWNRTNRLPGVAPSYRICTACSMHPPAGGRTPGLPGLER